jgi:hypothetical protein
MAIRAGFPTIVNAIHTKEIINFMSIFSDEVFRENIGLLIAWNNVFLGTAKVPSRRPYGKCFGIDQQITFEFRNPAGSTNG